MQTLAICLTRKNLQQPMRAFCCFLLPCSSPLPHKIYTNQSLSWQTDNDIKYNLYYGSLDARYSVYRSKVLVETPPAEGLLFTHASYLTEVSWETSRTQTLESIDFILAVTPIHARVTCTFIDVFLTVISCIARWTDAPITINQVLGRNKKI